MLDVSWELHVMSYGQELWFDCVLFGVLNYMPRWNKEQSVWMCLEHVRFQNAAEFGRGWPG